jgi:acetoin utilization deacetylase AcuC-like enzyme
MMDLADVHCKGKLVVVHEGGYSSSMVPFCGHAVIEQLSGRKSKVVDQFVSIVKGLVGQKFQKHHDEVIVEAEKLVVFLKARLYPEPLKSTNKA